MRTCFRPIPLLYLTLFSFQLGAVSVNTAQLATGPSNSSCAVPPVATSFLTTSTEIWAYLLVDQGAANDVLRVEWVNPSGQIAQIISFPPLPSAGTWCFDAWLSKAGDLFTPVAGTWTVRWIWNGTQTLRTLTFPVTAPGGGGGGGGTVGAFTNGSFELPGAGQVTNLPRGSTLITGWVVSRDNVDLVAGAFSCSQGNYCIDLDGSTNGELAQAFATTVGTTYTVTFDMAGNPSGTPVKRLQVSADNAFQEYTFDTTGRTPSNMGWTTKTFTFTATTPTMVLAFNSLSAAGSNAGPAIDNVRVTAGTTGGGGGGGSTAGTNLIQNGDAEASAPPNSSCSPGGVIPRWTSSGDPSVCAYGPGFGGPLLTSPGPPSRGNNFFAGGNATKSTMTQAIDVSSLASQIDAGTLPYTLSAYLGGYAGDGDNAQLTMTFRGRGSVTLGPVLPAERSNVSGLLLKSSTGNVPTGTRFIDLILEFNRTSGSYNDGYADNLSLILGTATGGGGGGGGGGSTGNLLTNGSFELPGTGDLLTLARGTTSVPGWTVTRDNVDLIFSFWSGSDGRSSLELDGTTAGAIAQTFATTPGTAYTVLFDMAGNPNQSNPFIKSMRVNVAGVSQDFSFDVTGKSPANMGWVARSVNFTATSTSTTLEFASLSPSGNFYGAVVDNVRVTPGTTTGGGGGGGGGGTVGAFINGGFETPGTAASFMTLPQGSTFINGWTVTRENVDLVGTFFSCSEGRSCIDLDGTTSGALAQTFATTAGTPYTVTFDFAGNAGSGPLIKSMRVAAAGTSQDFTFDTTGKTVTNMGWTTRTFNFTANSSSTTLEFSSLDGGGSFGPALDNVRVTVGTTGGGGGGGTGTLTITLSAPVITSPTGGQVTVTARVLGANNSPQANVAVKFNVLSGPNFGAQGSCNPANCATGADGQVSFTYTGTGGIGQDSITACITQGGSGTSQCCTNPVLSAASEPSAQATTGAIAKRAVALERNANVADGPREATKSNRVVIIGAATVDSNCATGANRIINGGCLPVTGRAGELGDFTFAGLAPPSVTAAALAQYDTAVINLASSGMACDTARLSAQAKTDIVAFVGSGKKLIIIDSECAAPGGKGLDFSWLPYPFTTANPGGQGSRGTLNIVENSTLGSAVTGSPYFVDAADLSNNTDAVGDMNVMTTKDSRWCLSMSGTNSLNVTGPVHAYAKYPAGTDSGLIIYNGLDFDAADNFGNANLRKIWVLELQQPFNTSNLPCGVAVVGITLSASSTTSNVGSSYTTTVRVADQLGKPQANVVVTFTLTGVNSSVIGTCNTSGCRTDANGLVTFTYTGRATGTDNIQACFTPPGSSTPVCSAPLVCTWSPPGGGGGTPTTLCATPVTITWTAGGPVCNYFVQSLTNLGVPAAGTRNGFFQIFTGLQCRWGAISNDSWITIEAGASGSGSPGAVSYSVAPNTSSLPRTGTITITDGTRGVQTHTVLQLPGGAPCSYVLAPTYGGPVPAGGGGGGTSLTTGTSCFWLATPNVPWIKVTPSSGDKSQILTYSVDVNTTTGPRNGTFTVGGQTFTVYQSAPAPPVPAGTPGISPGGIVNAASSRGGPIARGSFFTIYGVDIGPTVPSQATSYPIPDTAGGVVVNISQGSIVKRAFLHFVSSSQINGIIPSDAPLGNVQVTVVYNGIAGTPANATLVDTSFGIFTAASGVGPGIIQNWNSQTDVILNLPAIPGKPGQLAILWGTGLGPVAGADNNAPPVGDLPAPVEVEVAGMPATVVYHGRAPSFAGVDNVYFYVPNTVPQGCSVPVRIKAGPTWSNTVRMAINGTGGVCQDPQNPNSSLTTTGGQIGAIMLVRANLTGQFQAGQAPVNATLDFGAAVFAEIKAGGQLAFSGALNLPPVGSCSSNIRPTDFSALLGGDLFGRSSTVGRQLDAGSKIVVTGPRGSADLSPMGSNAGSYAGLLGGTSPLSGSASTPLVLNPGTSLTLSSPGGKDVGPISGSFTMPNEITWTNRDQINTINRATPLTLTWTGGDISRLMLIVGGVEDAKIKTGGGFMCLVSAAAGTFTVPVSVLADLPATRALTSTPDDSFGGIALASVPMGLPPTFAATGPGIRFIVTSSISLKTVQVQ